MTRVRLILTLLIWSLLLLTLSSTSSSTYAQEDPIDALIQAMSVEQRVAQLFLATFPGSDVGPDSPAAQLVRDLHVGGIVLRASNGNYRNGETAPQEIASLVTALQTLAYEGSAGNDNGPFVPLFVGLELAGSPDRPGDGLPSQGFTEIPTLMALGATWKPANAERVGQIVGQELRAVGINLLLGPPLDVVTMPRPGLTGDLGTNVFGGDPFWVSKMGRAFIRGVHTGSENYIAVVAQHFPGLGGSDRRPEEEIATVQKLLEELQRIDLPPYFEATAVREGDPLGTVDGLQTTHIRYRGLQGNIRQLTRPISLDAQNLPTILALPQFEPWRQQGLVVSEALGVPSLRRFYQDQLGTFPPRRVAQEAFAAGHDVLFVADFGEDGNWERQLANIQSAIQFFADTYRNDPVFADQVNRALRRILTVKRRIVGGPFELENVVPTPPDQLDPSPFRTPESQAEIARIAQEAATLIYPGADELADRLPSPPLPDENILIFTDAHPVADCPTCPPRPFIAPDALARALLQRYGPQASDQLTPERITSLTFTELDAYLDAIEQGEQPTPDLGEIIRQADWVIFVMGRVAPNEVPHSAALKRFLRLSGERFRSQRLIVFAMGAPYYLDATEISKLTAYFAFYAPTPTFVDTAARLLFQEFTPTGASPVSIPGISYDLITRLEPDPRQIIQVGLEESFATGEENTPQTLDVKIGDTVTLRTSVIVDRNGNPVPDGTPVTFILGYPNEGIELPRQQVTTENGVARTTITLEREGQLSVRVQAEPAVQSTTLLLTIQGEEPAQIATVVPPPTATPSPTRTPLPTVSAVPTRTPVRPTVTPSPTPTPRLAHRIPPKAVGWHTLAGTLLGLLLVATVAVARSEDVAEERLRRFLLVVTFGLSAYVVYFVLWDTGILPGRLGSTLGAILTSLAGGILGLSRWVHAGLRR